jgi:hypothetical protein
MTNMLDNALGQVARPLQDFMKKLSGSEGQIWLKAFKRFLRKENPWGTTAIGLIPLSEMNGVRMTSHASSLFNGIIGTVHNTESDNLKNPLDDHEIIEKFGEGIIFDSARDLEATIADLITKQLGGKKGKLLNNGYANIFYVRVNGGVCCVFVSCSGDREWGVGSHRVGGDRWLAGRRVFRNCGPLDT